MTWDELKATCACRVTASYEATIGRLSAAIQATPAAFFALFVECRANLDHIQSRLPKPLCTQAAAYILARYAEMKSLCDALVLGISLNAVQAPHVDVAPAVAIVVGSGGLTLAGVAWAVAA